MSQKKNTLPTAENGGSVQWDPLHKWTVKRTGRQIMRMQMLIRIAAAVVTALFLIVLLLYLFSFFSTQAGRFTVKTGDLTRGLALSETADFAQSSASLQGDPVESMDNITYSWLPADLDGEASGSHNGKNYIAYTFYVKNTGKEELSYEATLSLEWVKNRVDEAARVMLYRNGDATVYAKLGQDGTAEIDPEWETVPFLDTTTIARVENEAFAVGEVEKYTVVVWLEGEDPECVDDILGGELKMSMLFQVLDSEEAVSV